MNLHFTFSVREVSKVTDSEQTLKIPMYFTVSWADERLSVEQQHKAWSQSTTGWHSAFKQTFLVDERLTRQSPRSKMLKFFLFPPTQQNTTLHLKESHNLILQCARFVCFLFDILLILGANLGNLGQKLMFLQYFTHQCSSKICELSSRNILSIVTFHTNDNF